MQISNASVGDCTPPFRRFLLLLFFILFFALFITVSISWKNLFATLVPPLLCPDSSLKTHPLLVYPHWPNSTKSVPKSGLPEVVIGANSAYYWEEGTKHPHKLAVHNSNTLPPHSPRQISLLSFDSYT